MLTNHSLLQSHCKMVSPRQLVGAVHKKSGSMRAFRSLFPPAPPLAGPRPWNDIEKGRALLEIEETICDLEMKEEQMETLIEYNTKSAFARMNSNSKIGAFIFMKMVVQYERQRDQAAFAIEELEELAVEVEESTSYMDWQYRMEEIVEQASETHHGGETLHDEDDRIFEIKSRLTEPKSVSVAV